MPDLARMLAAAAEIDERQASIGAKMGARFVHLEHRMAVNAATPSEATVWLHGIVGDDWDSLDSGSFARDLYELDVDTVQLRINSPGGLVSHGVAIYGALREHRAQVVTHVDGIAASAASLIAMAGNVIKINKPARMMVHDAWGISVGDTAQMRADADILDGLSTDIAGVYADRAGGTPAAWRARMLAETWYSSSEAVDAGLADEVVNGKIDAPEDRASQLIRARARAHNILRG